MATDINTVISKLNEVGQHCAGLLISESENPTREVLSNLILANGATLRKVIDLIIEGQKKIDINDRPLEYASFEEIYKIGAAAKNKISSVTNAKKTELQRMLADITFAMTEIEKGANVILSNLAQSNSGKIELNANDLKQSLAMIGNKDALLPATTISPLWDDVEEKLLPMACCANEEWGLLYKVNDTRRVAFFPETTNQAQILAWCDGQMKEGQEIGVTFQCLMIFDQLGSRIWEPD